MLRKAGYVDVSETDVTDEYRATAQAWSDAAEQHRDELRASDPALFDERQRGRRNEVAAIDDGLLRRSLLLAVRPG